MEQIGVAIVFKAYYVESKVGKTGLTVTVDVYNPAGTLVVTAGSATEVGGGLYTYTLSSGSVTTEGEYVAIFKTTTTSVDQRHIPSLWSVGRAGIENLDATISSRLASSGYTAPSNADIATILGRTDVATSTRLAGGSYTAPDNAGIDSLETNVATLLTRLTNVRAGLLDNLDAAITTRLADADYVVPANDATIMAIDVDLDTVIANLETLLDRLTATRAGYLDAAISTRATADDFEAGADPLENAVPGDYPVGSAGYLLGQLSAGSVSVVSPMSQDGAVVSLVQGDTYDADEERALVWTSTEWPDLTDAVVELRVIGAGPVVVYACTVVDAATVSLELSSEQTESLAGRYQYRLVAQVGNDEHTVTLAEGIMLVARAR